MRGSGACSCPGPRSEAFLSRTQSGMPGPGRLALRQHRAGGRCVQVLCMEDSVPHSESGAGCDRADSLRERQPSGMGAAGRTCSKEAPAYGPRHVCAEASVSSGAQTGDDCAAH